MSVRTNSAGTGHEPLPNSWTPGTGSESLGGVERKDVSDGHSPRGTGGRRLSLWRRAGGRLVLSANELGLRDSVLRRWVEKRAVKHEPTTARRPTTPAALPSADQAAQISRLQRENERLRMERDILKKSIALFAGTRT
jgi:transposase